MKTIKVYKSPEVETLTLQENGVLCSSFEKFDDLDGILEETEN